MDKHGYNVFYLCIAAAMYALKQKQKIENVNIEIEQPANKSKQKKTIGKNISKNKTIPQIVNKGSSDSSTDDEDTIINTVTDSTTSDEISNDTSEAVPVATNKEQMSIETDSLVAEIKQEINKIVDNQLKNALNNSTNIYDIASDVDTNQIIEQVNQIIQSQMENNIGKSEVDEEQIEKAIIMIAAGLLANTLINKQLQNLTTSDQPVDNTQKVLTTTHNTSEKSNKQEDIKGSSTKQKEATSKDISSKQNQTTNKSASSKQKSTTIKNTSNKQKVVTKTSGKTSVDKKDASSKNTIVKENVDVKCTKYISDKYKVQFEYPEAWKKNSLYPERYEGKGGYFEIVDIASLDTNIDEVVNDEKNEFYEPFGENPGIDDITIDGQPARVITVDREGPEDDIEKVIIIKYPALVNISGRDYNYIMIWTNSAYSNLIITTFKFLQK